MSVNPHRYLCNTIDLWQVCPAISNAGETGSNNPREKPGDCCSTRPVNDWLMMQALTPAE